MKSSLIIPSAKNIFFEENDVGEISPVLFPINEKTALEYIYEKYTTMVDDILIITQKDEELIRNHANSFNENIDVRVTLIDKIMDLGYTIYFGLKNTHNEICYINFADSIVFDDISTEDANCIYYSEGFLSNDWTFFDFSNGKIDNIYDKNLQSESLNKKALFIGIFKISDSKFLAECLNKALNDKKPNIDSFYQALILYNTKYTFSFKNIVNWLDIGHQDNYYNSKLEVCARSFNHMRLDKDRGIITKYSDNKEKLIDEINWYLKIPKEIQFLTPRIYDYSTDNKKPYVSMEYYSYHTLHELYLYGNLDTVKWKMIFSKIIFLLNEFRRFTISKNTIRDSLINIYITKTVDRLGKLKENKNFSDILNNNISINGHTYCSPYELIELIKGYVYDNLLNISHFNIIHGDLCFSNVLIDNNYNFLKLIDPRGQFGEHGIYGDARYDLAKIFHCLDGKYDYIIKNMFNINIDGNGTFAYKVYDKKQTGDLFSLFTSCINFDYNINDIYFIEGLLFLSMVPLHDEDLKQQYAMLCTAYMVLERVLDLEV